MKEDVSSWESFIQAKKKGMKLYHFSGTSQPCVKEESPYPSLLQELFTSELNEQGLVK